MNDEIDSFGVADADLGQLTGPTWSDEHDEIVEVQNSSGVSVGVENVVVLHSVAACAGDDHRVHRVNLS